MRKISLTERNTKLAAIIRLLIELECSENDVARYLDIPGTTVHLWRRTHVVDWRRVDALELRRLLARGRAAADADERLTQTEHSAALQRSLVLSECGWLVRDDPAAQQAVRDYVQAMSTQPAAWWTVRGGESCAWWLERVAEWAEHREAA